MATLDQLYRAYLSGDPNVDKMVYDPFGWNYEQTFDTTEEGTDTDIGLGAVVPTTGGDNYGPYNPDPNKIRLPSSYRETPGLTQAGDQWLANQQLAEMGIDNPWASEAGLRIPYDAPDAGQYEDVFNVKRNFQETQDLISEYREANPKRSKGMSNVDILSEFAPSESIFPDYVSPGYDEEYDVNLEPGQQTWFNKMKSSLRNNPLMQGVMTAINPAMMAGKNILQGLKGAFPVNERAILENEALGSGIALDDIGRVVYRDYGKDPRTGEWGALDYDTPENVMAGYNYAQMDEDTFDKRIKNLKMKKGKARDKRIKAIRAAKQEWLLNKQKTDWITQERKLDRADEDQKTTIENFKTKENILEDDPSLHTFKTTPKEDKIIVPKEKPKVTGPTYGPHQSGGGGGGVSSQSSADAHFGGDTSVAGDVWIADGGMVKDAPRRPYGKGGIVDIL